jgi:hypothetical protein
MALDPPEPAATGNGVLKKKDCLYFNQGTFLRIGSDIEMERRGS